MYLLLALRGCHRPGYAHQSQVGHILHVLTTGRERRPPPLSRVRCAPTGTKALTCRCVEGVERSRELAGFKTPVLRKVSWYALARSPRELLSFLRRKVFA